MATNTMSVQVTIKSIAEIHLGRVNHKRDNLGAEVQYDLMGGLVCMTINIMNPNRVRNFNHEVIKRLPVSQSCHKFHYIYQVIRNCRYVRCWEGGGQGHMSIEAFWFIWRVHSLTRKIAVEEKWKIRVLRASICAQKEFLRLALMRKISTM